MPSYADLFTHEQSFTIGVEEEYMLCHPETGDLVPRADAIMELLEESERERFSYELIMSEIEINTPICESVAAAMHQIGYFRRRVRELGEELNFRVGISGTHPTALGDEQQFVGSPNYQWVAEQLHYYALRNITFANHVHVALPDAETAIAVTNAARRWLAPLLALSTNSPYFRAHDTGMLSSRTFQFGSFPRTNIPDTFRDFQHFQHVLQTYLALDSIKMPRQIWWKIRPHAVFGTVEFRVADMQRSLRRTEMLVALCQAICHRAAHEFAEGTLHQQFELEFLNDALWKATRFGFEARVIDPADEQILSLGELAEKMVNYVRPSLQALGTEDAATTVEEVLKQGSEAQEQRAVYGRAGFAGLKQLLMDEVEFGAAA
ncbi:MAG: YbdK family carboxylate-amine ligase [Candidatus Marinimicrobia bacterium]|nr:YbdK family carboxylate-amine ligase [Candidatus Neomarinimicrobiota bacterium]